MVSPLRSVHDHFTVRTLSLIHIFAVLQYQEMRFFDRNRTGDLMTRLSADLEDVYKRQL